MRSASAKHLADEDLELAERAVGPHGSVAAHLGPVDRDYTRLGQPCVGTESQDLHEKALRELVMGLAGAGEGAVVGGTVGTNNPVGDIYFAMALYLAARARPGAVGVHEQAEQHVGVISSPAWPVISVPGMERRGIQAGHYVDYEPSEVAFRQPLAYVNREQEQLVPVSFEITKSHGK